MNLLQLSNGIKPTQNEAIGYKSKLCCLVSEGEYQLWTNNLFTKHQNLTSMIKQKSEEHR